MKVRIKAKAPTVTVAVQQQPTVLVNQTGPTDTQTIAVTVPDKPKILLNQTQQIVRSIGGMSDVDLTGLSDGDLLIYNEAEGKFVASTLLEKQIINGGNF